MVSIRRNRRAWRVGIFAVYSGMFLFFVFKALFYARYVGRFPDEINHIGYIACLEQTGSIIPDFKNMMTLQLQNGPGGDVYAGTYVFSKLLNQLGHPPLYYQLMRLAHGVTVQGGVVVIHIVRLRLFSLGIACAGLLLVFSIGWRRLGTNPFIHLLYAAICVCVPMFSYVSAGVNNDTLAYVAFAIYLEGFLRYLEGRRGGFTYLLLSGGISLALLAKMTVALIAIGTLALYLLWRLVRHKDLSFFRRRAFWATLPAYAPGALYMIAVKLQTGTFQPTLRTLDLQQFINSTFYVTPSVRSHMSFLGYAHYFSLNFLRTWTGIASHVSLTKSENLFSLNQIGLALLFALPLLLFFTRRRGKQADGKTGLLFAYAALLAVILLQFSRAYWEFAHVSGYLGGYQSRYYLCAVPVLALCTAWGTQAVCERLRAPGCQPRLAGAPPRAALVGLHAVQAGCAGFTALLVYEDFIYFLRYFHQYL